MSPIERGLRIIGWEVEMGNPRSLVVVLLLSGCAASAGAQPVAARNVEIGAGVGGVLSWYVGGIPGADVRVSVPVSERRAVEGFVGLTPVLDNATTGFYGVLVRQRVGRETRSNPETFFSYGVVGGFTHYHNPGYQSRAPNGETVIVPARSQTVIAPPIIGMIGGGIQQRVAPRLSVRVEGQAIMALILPVGVRVAAGVSVPLGKLSPR